MTGDGFAKIFDFEGAFETRGEKPAKRGDEGGEGCEDEDVELHGGDAELQGAREEGGEFEVVGVGDEDGVGVAGESGEDVGAEILSDALMRVLVGGDGSRDIWVTAPRGIRGGRVLTLTGQMKYL